MQNFIVHNSPKSDFTEGYVFNSYGKIEYLKYVLASVYTLRRYDKKRPIALFCDKNHEEILRNNNLLDWFDVIKRLAPEHRSIVGFKHNVDKYMAFDSNLFLDSDIIWCKNPDKLWQFLSTYSFTITGTLKSDIFFGSYKDIRVLGDLILNKRKKTLKRHGLTYLSRVQSGLIFANDYETTKSVCQLARNYLKNKHTTHFKERILPDGSTEESDEWGFAMAMSKLNLPIIPWHHGKHSPQLDFVGSYVDFDKDFHNVQYLYFNNQFMNNLRGLKSPLLSKATNSLLQLFMPCMGDHLWVTPYTLHFSWKHEKMPFEHFAQKTWSKLLTISNSAAK